MIFFLQARDGFSASFPSASGTIGAADSGGYGGGGPAGNISSGLASALSPPSWAVGMGGSNSSRSQPAWAVGMGGSNSSLSGNVKASPFGPDWSRPRSPGRVIDGAGPEVFAPSILNPKPC